MALLAVKADDTDETKAEAYLPTPAEYPLLWEAVLEMARDENRTLAGYSFYLSAIERGEARSYSLAQASSMPAMSLQLKTGFGKLPNGKSFPVPKLFVHFTTYVGGAKSEGGPRGVGQSIGMRKVRPAQKAPEEVATRKR